VGLAGRSSSPLALVFIGAPCRVFCDCLRVYAIGLPLKKAREERQIFGPLALGRDPSEHPLRRWGVSCRQSLVVVADLIFTHTVTWEQLLVRQDVEGVRPLCDLRSSDDTPVMGVVSAMSGSNDPIQMEAVKKVRPW